MTTEWKLDNGHWHYMHVVDPQVFENPKEEENASKRHDLLQLLNSLGVLEYSRGYDGIYYDICIKQRQH